MQTATLEREQSTADVGCGVPDQPASPTAVMKKSAARRPSTFAGFRLSTLALVSVVAILLAWNAWMTRELVALKRHRLVSVSLATIISDFVRDQSHNQGSPDDAAMRTKMYLFATQKAMVALARDGTPVLASEAVLGNSVPDETAQVKAAVAKAMADQTGAH